MQNNWKFENYERNTSWWREPLPHLYIIWHCFLHLIFHILSSMPIYNMEEVEQAIKVQVNNITKMWSNYGGNGRQIKLNIRLIESPLWYWHGHLWECLAAGIIQVTGHVAKWGIVYHDIYHPSCFLEIEMLHHNWYWYWYWYWYCFILDPFPFPVSLTFHKIAFLYYSIDIRMRLDWIWKALIRNFNSSYLCLNSLHSLTNSWRTLFL